jgi:hypothetical protein
MAEVKIKRIFLTGPPGSMWSGVDRQLRAAIPTSDNTDITPARSYQGHRGAYFNLGNEFGEWILNFDTYTKEHIIETVDSVFVNQEGVTELVRIHKSHLFAYHLDKIKEMFPDDAIVIVLQEPHKCYVWWEFSGGHKTVYDAYYWYNGDYNAIWDEINKELVASKDFIKRHNLETSQFTLEWIKENFPTVCPRFEGANRTHKLILQHSDGISKGLPETLTVAVINPWNVK